MLLLSKGDEIGLVTMANPVTPQLRNSLISAIQLVKSFGLVPLTNSIQYSKNAEIMTSPQKRADAFNKLVSNEKVRAIMNLWGGYNSNDILDLIDWGALEKRDLLLIGSSDFTSILNAAYTRTGKVSYHWINAVWYGLDRYKKSKKSFESFFLREVPESIFILARPKIVRRGEGKGVLLGGNLETFEKLIGTPYYPLERTEKCILVLEDVGKTVFQIRASFQHLVLSGAFLHCQGLVLGNFASPYQPNAAVTNYNRAVIQLARKMLQQYSFPIIHSPCIGHEVPNEVLPIGSKVSLNTNRKYVLQ